MTLREYYTRCPCPEGKVLAPNGLDFVVAHIHLPPYNKTNDFPPPSHDYMKRQNPGTLCQCSTAYSHLHGRRDIIGVHLHKLSPTNTGDGDPSASADAANSDQLEGEDIILVGQRTPDLPVRFTFLLSHL